MKNLCKVIAVTLSLIMILSAVPFSSAFAVETTEESVAAAVSEDEAVAATVPEDEAVAATVSEEDSVGAYYSADWRTWSQGASDNYQMRQSGCWVTAQAKMLKDLGIAPDGFDPDDYMNWEYENNYLDGEFYQTNGRDAPIAYAGQQGKSLGYVHDIQNPTYEELMGYINSGNYIILQVRDYHYVYVDNQMSLAAGEVYFFQSRSNEASVGTFKLSEVYPNPIYGYVYSYDKPQQPTEPDDTPSSPDDDTYEKAARYVPNHIETDGTHAMFNPETMKMLLNMSAWAYELQADYSTWNSRVAQKYGYTQFCKTINSGTYDIGEYTVDEEYTDEYGNQQIRQTTHQNVFLAVNAGIALKEVNYNGRKKYAIAVAFRGSSDIADWFTDFKFLPEINGIHRGFSFNALAFYNDTKNLHFNIDGEQVSIYDMIQDMRNYDSKYCMLVTGHSLGAALADVFVGHYLYNDGISSNNVMAYTFAAPRSTLIPQNRDNIFNFINSDDPVTQVGSLFHFGKDFVYTPTESFKEANYTGRLFDAHRIPNSYRPLTKLLCSTNSEGIPAIESYTPYHTNGNNNFGYFFNANQYTYNKFDGDVFFTYGLGLYDGVSVEAAKDCAVSNYLYMNNADDYLLVKGNLILSLPYGNSNLSCGTVEVKGDFSEISQNGDYNHYWGTMDHKTIFSGSGVQTISFADPQRNALVYPVFRNTHIRFATAVGFLHLTHDTTLSDTDSLVVNDAIDLDGHSLTVPGDITAQSIIAMSGGVVHCNNATTEYLQAFNQSCTFDSNLNVSSFVFNNSNITVNGNCSVTREMSMTSDNDYLLVKGNLTMALTNSSYYSSGGLSAGTVEVKGNFSEISQTGEDCHYWETAAHKTIFSGSGVQTVSFASPERNGFENPVFQNTHVRFVTPIGYLHLAQNTVINDTANLSVVDTLALNGYSLTAADNISAGSLDSTGGTLTCNDLTVGHFFANGNFTVNGNLNVTTDMSCFNEASASVTVNGNCSISKRLSMNNDSSYLLINGSLSLNLSDNANGVLSAGTVEVKGNFSEICENDNNDHYCETGTHKTIFSGSGVQTISFANPKRSGFSNPVFQNTKIRFATPIGYMRLCRDTVINNTDSLVLTDALELNGYSLTLAGDITAGFLDPMGGMLRCNDLTVTDLNAQGNCTVNGDLEVSRLNFRSGQVTVNGDCTINKSLVMNSNSSDYLLVNGDLVMSLSENNEFSLSSGTVEVKGDFSETSETGGNFRYWETGTHKTIFSGSAVQTISFTRPSYSAFQNPVFQNTHICFETGIGFMSLVEDTVIEDTDFLVLTEALRLNGNSLTLDGDITAQVLVSMGGELHCDDLSVQQFYVNGPTTIDTDLTTDWMSLSNGEVTVNGELTASRLVFTNGKVTVNGNCNILEQLLMNYNDSDYLLVNGDLNMELSLNNGGDLSAGTVEVKGDFTEMAQSGSNNYRETNNHKTILSGSKKQTVSFTQPGCNEFSTLIINNRSKDGVVFADPISVTRLFNHNGCRFTLYNKGEGSRFSDYDGDYMTDEVDEFPLVPYSERAGDVDGDGKITVSDVTVIQRHIAEFFELTGARRSAADTNRDGMITISDVTLLQMYLAEYDVYI